MFTRLIYDVDFHGKEEKTKYRGMKEMGKKKRSLSVFHSKERQTLWG
jgi:hypothetical protein